MADLVDRLRAALAGRYSVERELGRGGMATVFLAEDLKHRRKVALKVLHPELAAAVGPDRFLREIEMVAGLTHPHVLPLYDSGAADGLLYYVMPWVEGESLRERLTREKQLPVDEAVRIAREVAEALEHAHRRGLVHRDVKPANILLEEGHAVVADFGVARAARAADAERMTGTGMAVGTPAYMSPEQAAGEEVDARSDVYALGCVLYEMLAGEPPLAGPTPQSTAAKRLTERPTPLPVLRGTIPEALDRVVRRTLEATPADRYATAADLASALKATSEAIPAPVQAPPPPPDTRAAGPRRRRFGPGARIGLGAGAIAALVAVWHFGLGGLPGTVRPAAASFFEARDRVVVSEFENRTSQEDLGLAVRQAVITDLYQSPFVTVQDRAEIGPVLRRMELPDTSRLTPALALELARREGVPAVIGGGVARIGAGYQLTGEIVEASTGKVVVRLRETAESDREVLGAVERLSRLLRRHLGESLGSLRRSRPLPEVTTASLEALELYARGIDRSRAGDVTSVVPLFEQAVALDTTFAAAYMALAIHYGNMGRMVEAGAAIDRARALGHRLSDRERFMVGASYHNQHGNPDSAAFYYERLLEIEPTHATALNNLGDIYEQIGRYEDALPLYRRALAIQPDHVIPQYNLMSVARALGRHALADSVLALTEERFPGSLYALAGAALNAHYAGRFEQAEAAGRRLVERYPGYPAGNAQRILASIEASRGHVRHALALADSATRSYEADGARVYAILSLAGATLVAWTGGQTDRVVPDLDRALDTPPIESPRWEHARLGMVAVGFALAGRETKARETLGRLAPLRAADPACYPFEDAARAVLALADGDPEAALSHLRAVQSRQHPALGVLSRRLTGDALARLGRWEEAATQYDSLLDSRGIDFREPDLWATLVPESHERLAGARLAIGDTASAIEQLQIFADMWSDADPELRPRVAAARARAEELEAKLEGKPEAATEPGGR